MLGLSSLPQTLVSWLLNKYAGKYIEDIDSRIKDVQFGPFGGSLVKLQNLNLKPAALVELDLPIEVKAGHIGLLELHIPALSRIYTDSVRVQVDDLILLAGPVNDRNYDSERDEELKQARKRETLNKLELLLQQGNKSEETEKEGLTEPGFIETIKLTVLQNLTVEISNIHIRYEDDVTNRQSPFSFGITLQELSLKPKPADNTDSIDLSLMNKVLSLKDLSVYWNCCQMVDKSILKNHLDTADWKHEMLSSIESMQLLGVQFDYLVEPINACADITLNTQSNFIHPKVTCNGKFDLIQINFKRHMFLTAMILKDSFAMMRVNEKYRMYHPGVPCSQNPRLWWRYAYDSIVETVVRPKLNFWTNIWVYRALYKKYRDLYLKRLLDTKLSEAETSKLEEYEMELNIESIVLARKEAEKMYIEKKPAMVVVKPASQGALSRLSNWWYGGTEKTEATVVHIKTPTTKPDNWWNDIDEKELKKAFHYNNNTLGSVADVSSDANSGYVQYKLDVCLDGIQINLLMDTVTEPLHIVTLFIQDIKGVLGVRVQGLKFTSSISHMEIFSNTDGPTNRTFIVDVDKTRAGRLSEDEQSLFYVSVEQYPTSVDADVAINIRTLPICVTYDHNVVCAMMAFFYIRDSTQSFDVGAQLMSIKPEFSTEGLQYAIDNHQRIHVVATLYSPCLIIPASGHSLHSDSKLIVDLGRIQVSSDLRPKDVRLGDAPLADREQLMYDKYKLSIMDVMIIFSQTSDDGSVEEKRLLPDSDLHLMPSLKLTTDISLCAEPNFTQVPKFKVDSELDRLILKVSTDLIETVIGHAYKFPHPSADEYFEKNPLRKIKWSRLSSKLPAYGGATFVRWGKKTCPKTAKTVYSGMMTSPDLNSAGGGANYQCLVSDPRYHSNSPGKQYSSLLSRVWYQVVGDHDTVNPLTHHSVPCTVCEANQQVTKLMIPGDIHCPDERWQLQYSGYLMSSASHGHPSGKPSTRYYRTNYVCVDSDFESFAPRPNSAWEGSPLYLVRADCSKGGTLGYCPPYDGGKSLACAVCTK